MSEGPHTGWNGKAPLIQAKPTYSRASIETFVLRLCISRSLCCQWKRDELKTCLPRCLWPGSKLAVPAVCTVCADMCGGLRQYLIPLENMVKIAWYHRVSDSDRFTLGIWNGVTRVRNYNGITAAQWETRGRCGRRFKPAAAESSMTPEVFPFLSPAGRFHRFSRLGCTPSLTSFPSPRRIPRMLALQTTRQTIFTRKIKRPSENRKIAVLPDFL
jgi:hypothetical protein